MAEGNFSTTPPSRRLRVVVLDEGLPYPLDSGKRIRTWNLLSRLAKQHDIHLICYEDGDHGIVSQVEKSGIHVHLVSRKPRTTGVGLYFDLFSNLFSLDPYSVSKHYSKQFQNLLNESIELHPPDLIHIEWTPYARYLPNRSSVRTLVATHNIEAQIWFRRSRHSATSIEKTYFALQGIKMRAFEKRYLARVDGVTAVSLPDMKWLQRQGIPHVSLVENGVDLEYFQPSHEMEDDNLILFLASLDWFPNQDALQLFLSEILPRVRAEVPGARLEVVGRRPPAELQRSLSDLPGVSLHADVSDVRPFLAKAALVVVPLRIGGGTRIKILESMAAGKAVIATTIGAESLDVKTEEHLLIADTPSNFASQIVRLLKQPEFRRILAANGRQQVARRYSWSKMAQSLETAWLRAVSGPPHSKNGRPLSKSNP